MRVLVTGAAGFLGSHIIKALVDKDHQVQVLDTEDGFTSRRLESCQFAQCYLGDITQPLPKVLPPVDAIIHLAGVAAPRDCNNNPIHGFNVNVQGTYNVLKWAVEKEVQKLVFASTAHVYSMPPKYMPTDEQHPLFLHDTYTTTKILGERLCQLFHENYGLQTTVIRLFNAFGPGQALGYFIPDITQRAQDGLVELRGGETTKDFVFVDDVARAFVQALSTDFVGPINIGSGAETKLSTIARMIAERLGAEYRPVPYDNTPITRMLCDNSRALRVLGWEPKTSLLDGLNLAIADHISRESIRA